MADHGQNPAKTMTAYEEAEAFGIDMALLEEQIKKTPAERFESLVRIVDLLQQINPRIAEQNVPTENDFERPPERSL